MSLRFIRSQATSI